MKDLIEDIFKDKILKQYNNIDNAYKKSFYILLCICFFIFFITITNLNGFENHDWNNQYSVNIRENFYIGRIGANLLTPLLCLKILPLLNIILFFIGNILGLIMLSQYWGIPKKEEYIILFVLFWITMPTTLTHSYYLTISLGFGWILFFFMLSVFLTIKAKSQKKLKKFLFLFLAYILLVFFVFGVYPPAINLIFVILSGKCLLEFKNAQFNLSGIKNFILEHKYLLLILILTIISTFMIYIFLYYINILDTTQYNIFLTETDEILNSFLRFLKFSFSYLIMSFPYIGIYVKSLLLILVILAALDMFNLSIQNKNKWGIQSVKNFIIILSFFILMLLSAHCSYFISDGIKHLELRIEHFGGDIFYLFCAGSILSGKNILRKNIGIILILLIIINGSLNCLYEQKVKSFAFENELRLQNRLLGRIELNKNFSYDKEYSYIQIGQYNNFKRELYAGPEYKSDIAEFTLYYITDGLPFALTWLSKRSLFYGNIEPYDLHKFFNDEMNNEFGDFLRDKAKPYPSEDSIFINDKYIIVVFDEKYLEFLRKNILCNFG